MWVQFVEYPHYTCMCEIYVCTYIYICTSHDLGPTVIVFWQQTYNMLRQQQFSCVFFCFARLPTKTSGTSQPGLLNATFGNAVETWQWENTKRPLKLTARETALKIGLKSMVVSGFCQKAPKGNESSSEHPFEGAFAVSSREGRFLVSSGQTPRNKLQVISDQLCWDVWTSLGGRHWGRPPCT